MREKQATGVDTRAMLPIYAGIFNVICELFLPWFSMPVLKYSKLPTTYNIWSFWDCIGNMNKSIEQGGKLRMQPLTPVERMSLCPFARALKAGTVFLLLLMCICAVFAYTKKKQTATFVRISFFCAAVLPVAVFLLIGVGNAAINQRMGRANDFINLTLHSYIQMTPWMYAQFIISVIMVLFAGKFLNTDAEYSWQAYIDRSQKKDHRIGKRTLVAACLILFAIPFLIFFGIFFLNDRSNNFIALCIIGLAMVPFCMVFEERKPQAREILLIAVMSALAVAGRMAFFMIPQFKPVAAIVIIAGVGLGAEAGFLTGAVSGFVSNFFFGQGPWTPWQMFAFGIIGFLAGLIFHKNKLRSTGKNGEQLHKLFLCIYGGTATFFLYGFLLDSASVTIFLTGFSWDAFLAKYISGIPFNAIHGVSTVIFLFFLSIPMERKLDRIKKKYGILEV